VALGQGLTALGRQPAAVPRRPGWVGAVCRGQSAEITVVGGGGTE
jgi:hypothetical protein